MFDQAGLAFSFQTSLAVRRESYQKVFQALFCIMTLPHDIIQVAIGHASHLRNVYRPTEPKL